MFREKINSCKTYTDMFWKTTRKIFSKKSCWISLLESTITRNELYQKIDFTSNGKRFPWILENRLFILYCACKSITSFIPRIHNWSKRTISSKKKFEPYFMWKHLLFCLEIIVKISFLESTIGRIGQYRKKVAGKTFFRHQLHGILGGKLSASLKLH